MQNMQKMCIGFPATYRNQCMECRVLEMRNIYERDRVGRFGKENWKWNTEGYRKNYGK